MKKISKIKGLVAPLKRNDVDTDQIIPARFLTSVSSEGFSEALFADIRKNDEDFVLNKAEYKSAKILIAGNNFGCGSSREHAVWALRDAGVEAIIAKSFADIFFSNSAKNGLLLIKSEASFVDSLFEELEKNPASLEADISLEEQTCKFSSGKELSFDYDSFRKHCLLNGLEDLEYILSESEAVNEYMKKRSENLFYSTEKINNQN